MMHIQSRIFNVLILLQVNKYHSVLHLVLPGIPQQTDLPEEAPNSSKTSSTTSVSAPASAAASVPLTTAGVCSITY